MNQILFINVCGICEKLGLAVTANPRSKSMNRVRIPGSLIEKFNDLLENGMVIPTHPSYVDLEFTTRGAVWVWAPMVEDSDTQTCVYYNK